MPTIAKYAKETFWAVAAKGAAFFFYYGLVYYLTRRMTVDSWGDWSAFLALLNVILLTSDQGINTASKRYLAPARDTDALGGVVRATFVLRVCASLAFAAVIAAAVYPLLSWLNLREYAGFLQRSLLLIVLSAVLEYFKNLFEAIHRLRFTFLLNLIEHGGKLLFVVLLFKGGNQFSLIVTAFTLAVAIAVLAGIISSLRVIPNLFRSPRAVQLIRRTYVYSLPIFLMSIGGFAALEIDTIMLRKMSDAYQTGIYSAAKNIVMCLPHFGLAFSMGIIPGLAVFDAESARANRRLFYQTLAGVTGMYLVIILGVALFAVYGLDLFFPSAYRAASIPLLLLTPYIIFSGVSGYCGHLLDYRGLAWVRSLNFAATIILNVLLNLWLIPKWGAAGAAISSLAFAPYCLLNLWQADRAFRATRRAPA